MKKYLLDTNVLLSDPDCLKILHDKGNNKVIVPFGVLRELDTLKSKSRDEGLKWQVREATRVLEKAFEEKIIILYLDSHITGFDYYDDKLLEIAKRERCILITSDKLLILKALSLGVAAELYKEVERTALPPSIFTKKEDCIENQFVREGANLYRKIGDTFKEITLDMEVFNIVPKNIEQAALFDVLLDAGIQLVAITGQAGTGKNLCTLAAALEQLVDKEVYNSLKVARAPIPSGNDIGYLPGTMEEKLNPWLRGLHDNLDFLFNYSKRETLDYFKNKFIETLSTTHIKGASIPNSFIIIDEAQDLTIREVKLLVTRAAIGTKIVLLGDIDQISAPYLSKKYNGLSYLIKKFYGSKLFSYVHLNSSVRSRLAQEAVERL
jgi:PhoH-like ATPase